MIKKKDAEDVLKCLRAIQKQIDRYYAEDHWNNTNDIMEMIGIELEELRCVIWHEMPLKFARIMDDEDGYTREIQF